MCPQRARGRSERRSIEVLVETSGRCRSVRGAPWIRSTNESLSLGAVVVLHVLVVRLLLRQEVRIASSGSTRDC